MSESQIAARQIKNTICAMEYRLQSCGKSEAAYIKTLIAANERILAELGHIDGHKWVIYRSC